MIIIFCHILEWKVNTFFKKIGDSIDKHEHVIFELDDNTELRYRDTRKFGKMYLIKKEDIDKIGPLVELGLEPWG